jgi:hypothetical protein
MIKKLFVITVLSLAIVMVQSMAAPKEENEKPKNLKVLPKNLSREEVVTIMKGYSKSLGVKCDFCHKHDNSNPPNFDFASDEPKHKLIARQMIKMVDAINKKYLDKIGHGKFDKITCVTCHRGDTDPLVNLDSLPKKERKD